MSRSSQETPVHLCQNLLLNKVAGSTLKRDLDKGVFLGIFKIFKNTFLKNTFMATASG